MNAAVVQTGNPTTSNDGYHFKSADHYISGFQEMHKMQRNGKLCDIQIKVGGEVHRAHKLVFASVSKYFSDLFDDEEGKVEINIDYVTSTTLRAILLFLYTGEITITEYNLEELLLASKRLNIAMLEIACGESMSKLINPRTWVQIIAIARAQKCGDLYEKCHAYAVLHFKEIVENDTFLQLPFCEVKELIKDSEFIVRSEVEVYSAVLNWVKHDLINRRANLSELMVYVKFPLIDKTYFFHNVISEPIMTDNLECSKLLLEATKSHFGAQCEQSSAKVLPRKYLKEHFVFVAGGRRSMFDGGMSECEIYNPRTNTWQSFSPMLCKRRRHGLVGFRRLLLYAFGGLGGGPLSSAEYYDPLIDSWAMTTPLPQGRWAHGVCSTDNSIYICGGINQNDDYLNSVDKFDPITATYMTSPPMKTSRSHFNMAISDNCLYAIGGVTDGYQFLKSMEIFDPREGKWSEAPSKSIPGPYQSVAVLDGFIYTSPRDGGRDWERFNIKRNSWEAISVTSNKQDHVNHNGCLYMLGSYIYSIQKYDPNKNSIIQMPPMINKRYELSAVMMDSIDIKDIIKLNDS